MTKQGASKQLIFIILVAVAVNTWLIGAQAEQCRPESYVYGENEVVDQLMVCSQSKLFDLDLTPQGDYVKSTPKALVEQGLSNKTTVLFARLSGLWTARRPNFVETGWRCEKDTTSLGLVVEFSGLALEVVERVDLPLHRHQHKLFAHKPCKMFDLPLSMCRQAKPIYRTTKTWVNRAYFNLTLSQSSDDRRPSIERLSIMFTCPETFKQKVTHSPSAMYLLSEYMHAGGNQQQASGSQHGSSVNSGRQIKREVPIHDTTNSAESSITHPVSYMSTQDGKRPATPPYHNSVNLINHRAAEVLRASLGDCIETLDLDLSLMRDYRSFSQYKYKDHYLRADDDHRGLPEANKCSNKLWLKQRMELAIAANLAFGPQQQQQQHQHQHQHQLQQFKDTSHSKRSQSILPYPNDPNQLLDPYGFYHENADQMIEDS